MTIYLSYFLNFVRRVKFSKQQSSKYCKETYTFENIKYITIGSVRKVRSDTCQNPRWCFSFTYVLITINTVISESQYYIMHICVFLKTLLVTKKKDKVLNCLLAYLKTTISRKIKLQLFAY